MAKGKKSKGSTATPLMRQYGKIKEKHPDAILLFRMGDFYETFENDAILASEVLGITLTKRANGKANEVPLAGFPHHSLDTYLPKLVRAGYRVAICEQLEDPKMARKIVKRGVVEVVSPGVSFRDQMLEPKHSNYLAAVHFGASRSEPVGIAYADATTGAFTVAEVSIDRAFALLETVAPSEILFDRRQREQLESLGSGTWVETPLEDWCFGFDFAYETLLRHFSTHSLKGFGVDGLHTGLVAAGATMHYLGESQKGKLAHITKIVRLEDQDFILLDPQTRRNLELVASMHTGGRDGSLIQILDETLTPMGGRLLRHWLVRPLKSTGPINERLDAVQSLLGPADRGGLRELLRHVGDLERLIAKITMARASPRDLVQLRLTLEQVPEIKTALQPNESSLVKAANDSLSVCQSTVDRIATALVDDPPANLGAGGVIRDNYSEELDDLRKIASSGKDWLLEMQTRESERTGIPSLKVGFNRVFGYYLEITNAHKDKVPPEYVRKQTLVNAERYITPELKEYEEKILTAEERIGAIESKLFEDLRMVIAEDAAPIQQNAWALSNLDVLQAFAESASKRGYCRPAVNESRDLLISDARHPVVEAMLPPGEPFIPNDITLGPDTKQILIITGPNMAGKSVVLRQTGLIVLLAQVGSFVPASKATIGIVDRIFTRVGASDNLAAGESTFLVEMNETANILNNATDRSLILLDEVGRGTSTFDGLSIAWTIVEYLHENPEVAARTLFATHYHELNALAERHDRIANARVQVQEHNGKVVFLRKLIAGGADHSYGIEVAKMAGLPGSVIERAREVLSHLESGRAEFGGDGQAPASPGTTASLDQLEPAPDFQMSLFQGDPRAQEVLEALESADPNNMTPIEAMMLVAQLKRIADS